jgi:major membrane immunogen (membrane-anchored lipoprotein)
LKTKRALLLIAALAILLLTACGGAVSYRDGVFLGRSGADDDGAWGEVTLTIQNGELTDCEYVTRQADGSIKDAEYGKINGEISNRDFYEKAQLAVRAMSSYAAQLKATKKLKDVDAVSGATIAYDQFTEAVENALGAAKP